MKRTLYIRPVEFLYPYWNDNQLLSSIHNIFLIKKLEETYIDTVSLTQICADDALYKDYKLVIIFPMPLDSTNLLGENSYHVTIENKIHTKIWFILLEICLKICQKRKDTLIVTGCDWDEHNVSNFNNHSVISLVLNKFRKRDISFSCLVWLYNNPFVPEWLELETVDEHSKVFTLFYSSYLPRCATIIENIYKPTFSENKTFWFLCLNRNPRMHRINICYWWYRNGKKPAHFSYRNLEKIGYDGYILTENGYDDLNKVYNDNQLDGFAEYEKFIQTLPWELDNKSSPNLQVAFQDTLPAEFIKSSACYIITETNYDHETDHKGWLTEKTLKCFAYGMPGIWIAPAFTLKAVKKLGFKTFTPLINEDYDNEISCSKRMKMVIAEVDRLQNIKDINNWYEQGIEIYKHNFNHLTYLINRDLVKILENYHNQI